MSNLILEAENLSFKYKEGESFSLKDISFSLERGTFLSVIGPNGSGKSTLLNLLCGFKRPNEGRILLEGKDIKKYSMSEKAKVMSLVSQRQDISFPFTALEIVLMGLSPFMSPIERVKDDELLRAGEIMERIGVWHLRDKNITQVSGGESQRVILARALIGEPRLLILDEAMSETDINARYRLMKIIRQEVEVRNMSVVFVNHDLFTAFKFSDKILAMSKGKRAFFDTPENLLNKDFFREEFSVDVDIAPDRGFIIKDSIV